jgi:peptidoglycan/LPS O-acetylase OafA/YrhL
VLLSEKWLIDYFLSFGMDSITIETASLEGGQYLDSPVNSVGRVGIKLEFQVTSTAGSPNLFQTSDLNSGLRAELAGTSIELLYPQGNATRSVTLSDRLVLGQWYAFDLEAVRGKYIRVRLTGAKGFATWNENPVFSTSSIRIGVGFDDQRIFNGNIRNVSISTGEVRSETECDLIVQLLKAACVILFSFSLFVASWPNPTPVSPSKEVGYYDPLLTLRAMACLMVLIGHGMIISFVCKDLTQQIKEQSWIGLLTASPWGGVWVFFTLSGFLMGKGFFSGRYQFSSQGVLNFYRNRALRIIPIYFSAVFLVSALMLPEIFNLDHISDLLRLLLFDSDTTRSINPIGALWSVSTEVQYYLIAPFVYWYVGRHIRSVTGAFTAMIFMVGFGLAFRFSVLDFFGDEMWASEVYKSLIGNIDLFLIGFFLNYFVKYQRPKALQKNGLLLGFVSLAVVYIAVSWISGYAMVADTDGLRATFIRVVPTVTGLGTCLTIYLFEVSSGKNKKTLATKILKRTEILGLLTYAIYVWHEPIYFGVGRASIPPATLDESALLLAKAFMIVLVIGYLMWRYIEVPFELKKNLHVRS